MPLKTELEVGGAELLLDRLEQAARICDGPSR
jgi:hypothetical protein